MLTDGVPFDQGRYGYLTDITDLTPQDQITVARFEEAKKNFISSAEAFQSSDENARASHEEEKNSGMTDKGFVEWAFQDYPSWFQAGQVVQANAAQLRGVGIDAYGPSYGEQVSTGIQELQREGWEKFGGVPTSLYLL